MAALAGLWGRSIPVRPPLKWAGGKRWLAPYLAELWAAHQRRRLVEPFCGGLGVALSLRPKRGSERHKLACSAFLFVAEAWFQSE
jgi:site-specific DNA-adenine methylase